MATVTDRWGIAWDEDELADIAARAARVQAEKAALKAALKARRISYAALAREAGCSPSWVSALLADHCEWDLSARVRRAAERLGLL